MIRRLSLLILFLAIIVIADPAEAKKVEFQAAPPPPEGYGLVYIYRIKVPPGMRTPKILVDGTPALKLPDNSYSWFYVSPGSHAIKSVWGFMSDVPELEFVANVQPGQTYWLKLKGTVQSWGIGKSRVFTGIEEVASAVALTELEGVKKYSPAMIEKVTASPVVRDAVKQIFEGAPPPPAGYALVYIYRPDSPPTLRRAGILVDEKEVLKLPNKGYSWFYVSEGSHTVKTNWGSIYRGVPVVEMALPAEAGKTYYIRLSGTKVPQGTYDAHTSTLDLVTGSLGNKELVVIKKYAPADLQKVD